MNHRPILFVWIFLLFGFPLVSNGVAAPPPPVAPEDILTDEVEAAIRNELRTQSELSLVYLLYETRIEPVRFSVDRDWALAQLTPLDPQSGQVIPAEPGLAIARHTNEMWRVFLPNNPAWKDAIKAVPKSLLGDEDRMTWLSMYQQATTPSLTTVFSGYKLPWKAGVKLVLTQSISHNNPPNPSGSMHYAFDFAAHWDATNHSPMFEVLSAKAGQVKFARWTQPDGDASSPGNYLVIEDTTTSPATYDLYLHLAYDSIPIALRQTGAPVLQGQTIGLADDTGNSTGNHLHFQVHTNPSSYWGNSVDISFDDVAINGGRPRTPAEATNWPQYGNQGQSEYTSGNTPAGESSPPSGGFYSPENGFILENPQLQLLGWAEDDTGLSSIQIKAYYDDAWHTIGPAFSSSPYSYLWDLCASQVPDGPVSLSLDIQDNHQNSAPPMTGLQHFIKQYQCPATPPACVPGPDQVALFEKPDFQGACVLIGTGTYTSTAFGTIGDNNVESVRVGSQVWATLFDNIQQGRGETLVQDDSNLSDNRTGTNTLSSLLVMPTSTVPVAPAPIYPSNNAVFPAHSSLSLSWDDRGGGTEFQVKWDGVDQGWQSQPYYHLGSIESVPHFWQVRSRNHGGISQWSTSSAFSLSTLQAPTKTETITAPFIDSMENGYNGWARGEWDQTPEYNHTPDGSTSFNYENNDRTADYDTGSANSGYLTSPSITIPSPGYYLRFWYLYETESSGPYWDQRWVQISVNGSPFYNVLQLFDDPPELWLESPPIDLSAYAGDTIQVRFLFETMDSSLNIYKGWYIDDFSINVYDPPDCSSAGEPDSNPSLARSMTYNSSLSGQLCPQGDIDYYQFAGHEGDLLGISASANTPFTPDTYLYLLDSDFGSILAENDDRISGILTDSYLSYRLSRDGTYFIKLRAWNHPSAGGSEYNYSLSLHANDSVLPDATLLAPAENASLPFGVVNIQVDATDISTPGEVATGVSHVDFFWHSGDWESSSWTLLGSDWDGTDGWGYNFATENLPEQDHMALFVRAYDWAGNWRGAAVWNLRLDLYPFDIFLPVMQK